MLSKDRKPGRRGPVGPRGFAGPPRDPARHAALWVLARHVRRFPDFELETIDERGMSPLDAAFAHALVDAVLRHWLTLRYLIDRLLEDPTRRVDARAMASMMAGAAQVIYMDKVPVHAAVHEAVEWVKGAGAERSAGMVNAVLRRISNAMEATGRIVRDKWTDMRDELPLADGRALVLGEEVLPADPVQRWSVATSHPIELLRHWAKAAGTAGARDMALHGMLHAPVILNTAHARGDLPPILQPHDEPGHHVFTGTHAELVSLLESRRDLWVQDPGSSAAVRSAAALSPALIVDVCAGQGTKTRQMHAVFPQARIVATDIDPQRFETLQRAFEGVERVQVVPADRLIDFAGAADLVLLDVPCSNSGVLARRVEARYRFDADSIGRLAGVQRQIIADSIRLLRTGSSRGRVLYSTCSLDDRENGEQARWACRWHALRLAHEQTRRPTGLPGQPPSAYRDGSYHALLE